jgi:hypothetical protein
MGNVGAVKRFNVLMTVEGRTGGGGAVGRIVPRPTAAKVERVEQ